MDKVLNPGLQAEAKEKVSGENTAKRMGSGDLEVYATPAMVALMEKAAVMAVAPHMAPGQTTVGIEVRIKHIAATPIGMEVRAQAELTEVDGRRLVFRVEAFDEQEKIGEGIHQRFIIQANKFMDKVQGKL